MLLYLGFPNQIYEYTDGNPFQGFRKILLDFEF